MDDHLTSASRSAPRSLPNLDRLIFLIDGVFAITLTLLALDLRLPAEGLRALPQALSALGPRLAIYLFAFVTIANQWVIHHRTFQLVHHADGNLVMLSLVNLLFITLIPASAALVGAYPLERLAAACFAINSVLLCFSAAAVWWYVAKNEDLLAEGADHRRLSGISSVWSIVGLGFAVSLVAGVANIYAECALWLLWFPAVSFLWACRQRQVGSWPPLTVREHIPQIAGSWPMKPAPTALLRHPHRSLSRASLIAAGLAVVAGLVLAVQAMAPGWRMWRPSRLSHGV
jgi:uncharacterized membrane protein